MKTLLVYPKFPASYWGFQHCMPLVGKRASLPPLGLVSLAALLPTEWSLRLVDLNVEDLTEEQLLWADVVFVGGMRVQGPSMHEVIQRAKAVGKKVAVGGPAPTTAPQEYADADVVFVGEAEERIDSLVAALAAEPQNEPPQNKPVVLTPPAKDWHPKLEDLPVPRYDLLTVAHYTSMAIQYSRGCPFSCEFCDIIEIFGRKPRVKSSQQVLEELETIHHLGFTGSVFFVDDNFICNKTKVKALLPDVTSWQKQHNYPFEFYTEASVNLAEDEALITGMVEAGFTAAFLGIESPSPETLKATGKMQNARLDLSEAVNTLTAAGIEVYAGFIVGFDTDTPDVFALQREFISNLPLPLAMVGLLHALPGTALWRRLDKEGRLRTGGDGHQFGPPNFEPKMDEKTLVRGYAQLLASLYEPEAYYQRCEAYIDTVSRPPGRKRSELKHIPTLLRSAVQIGMRSPHRRLFWRLLTKSLREAPHTFAWAVGHAVMGEHLIRYTSEEVVPLLNRALAEMPKSSTVRPMPVAELCA